MMLKFFSIFSLESEERNRVGVAGRPEFPYHRVSGDYRAGVEETQKTREEGQSWGQILRKDKDTLDSHAS